jgi:hypothetical protein
VALGRLKLYGIVLATTSAFSAFLMYLFIGNFGISVVIYSEILMLIIQVVIYHIYLNKKILS